MKSRIYEIQPIHDMPLPRYLYYEENLRVNGFLDGHVVSTPVLLWVELLPILLRIGVD